MANIINGVTDPSEVIGVTNPTEVIGVTQNYALTLLNDDTTTMVWVDTDDGNFTSFTGDGAKVNLLFNLNRTKYGTNTYTSDFSSSTDGWGKGGGDETATLTYSSDIMNLAVTSTGTNTARPFILKSASSMSMVSGTSYTIEIDFTLNSGTCELSLVNVGALVDVSQSVSGSKTMTFISDYTGSTNMVFYFNGTSTFDLDITEIRVNELNPYHLRQFEDTLAIPTMDFNTQINALQFAGGNDRLVHMEDLWSTFTELSVYMVVKQNSWTNGDYILAGRGGGDFEVMQYDTSPGFTVRYPSNTTRNDDLALNTWGLITIIADNSDASKQVNDNTAVSGIDAGTIDARGFVMGGSYGGSKGGDVDFRALIIRTGKDSSEDQAIIKGYLNDKYTLY